MIDMVQKNNCIGCKACMISCPSNAILFEKDREGFEYPSLSSEKCSKCGKCLKACPVYNNVQNCSDKEAVIYAIRHKDRNVLRTISSGEHSLLLLNGERMSRV